MKLFILLATFAISASSPEEPNKRVGQLHLYSYDNSSLVAREKRQQWQWQQYQYPTPQVSAPSTKYPPVVCPPNNPAWNKLIAMQVDQDYCDLNPANMGAYIAPDYIEHDANTPDGLEVEKASISPGGVDYIKYGGQPMALNFLHVAAIDDYVWIHSTFSPKNGPVNLALDLYRFECGKIKEHWCVIQPIDPNQPVYNSHPYF